LYALIGLLLDLIGAYLVHLVEHKTKVLWRFHLIHHTDTWIDTTTANRHHPGVIRFTFTAIGVLLIGSPMWLVFLYQPYPLWLHNSTMLIFRFKKSRYYFKLFYCLARHTKCTIIMFCLYDSNYGNIFSIWDRLLNFYDPPKEIIYGIDTHQETRRAQWT
jgi:sterol desaturase/sphingolipid hydroxylase (fatty acid hydroxylase superfamily)